MFHAGTFMIAVSTVLLIVASISAPTVSTISFLTATYPTGGGSTGSTAFGALGACVSTLSSTNVATKACSVRAVGYNITSYMSTIQTYGTLQASSSSSSSTPSSAAVAAAEQKVSALVDTGLNKLTYALLLHPLAAGISGLAFVVALFSDRFGFLFAALLALLSFAIALVAFVIDIVLFSAVKLKLSGTGSGIVANYGSALWITLVAWILLFFSVGVTASACLTSRKMR